MKIHIYAVYFPTSNKYYIGQTNNLKGRMFQHLNSKSLVGKALRKYDDWQVSILHTCKTRDEANRIEIEEIRNFNCVAPNGYNLTRGGSDSNGFEGHKHSEETKKKMSKRMQGKQYGLGYHHTKEAKERMQGKQHTKESKRKISEAMKGNQHLLGKKLSSHSKWMKENNPTKRLEVRIKIGAASKGRKCSKETVEKMALSKTGNKNPMKRADVKIKHHIAILKSHIKKLENELEAEK